ncbi:MAG: glycosyltransferase family 2 protein [Flavobacterium sp.]|jgi:teichuronic acid biosynthesis glycosyltransferase TuaG
MNQLVSIITPAFNSEKYIEATIASVQAQTYQNWEMIIIDDCSKDKTIKIVKEIILKDNRIKLIQLTENAGSGIARNKGIERASGSYLTFLDADDIWLPNFISASIENILVKNVPFVFSSYKRSNEKLEFVYSDFIVPTKVGYWDVLKTNSISCLTAFLDIELLGKKYMPSIKKRQDMGLWLQYLKEIPYAYGIKEPLAIYRIRENSLSRNKWQLLKYQWDFYYNLENLGFLKTIYYLSHWAINGFLKYRN